MIQVLSKEFNSFLNSLIAYVVIGAFLVAMGLLMWVFPETSVLEYGYADMETLFTLGPYVLMFLVPAVTMRSFSEENKAGTIELLITKPLTDWQILLGKFFACFLLVCCALIPTVVYYFSLRALGTPPGNIDTPGVIGSYIGLIFLGGVFTSVGILASSITRNQIIAFITAAFLCFLLFSGFESAATLNMWSSSSLFIKQVGLLDHYESMSRGLIDSRDVIFFSSIIALMLVLTKTVISSRQW